MVRVPSDSDFAVTALWATEEALRAPAVGMVCAEIEDMDLTASRRLQLAAETGGGLGLLLRPARRDTTENALPPTASVSRWRISSLPGAPAATSDTPGCPKILPGQPRWQAELLRARGGQPQTWQLEWRDARDNTDTGRHAREAAGGFALVSPLCDRPLPKKAPAAGLPQETRRARAS